MEVDEVPVAVKKEEVVKVEKMPIKVDGGMSMITSRFELEQEIER